MGGSSRSKVVGQGRGASFPSLQRNSPGLGDEGDAKAIAEEVAASRRFYVRAPSVNAVRRSLHRAPGGARVVGRHDRETIACLHTMDSRSFSRNWTLLLLRLDDAGLTVVPRPSP